MFVMCLWGRIGLGSHKQFGKTIGEVGMVPPV